jgi:aldose sugar dehydrogenase
MEKKMIRTTLVVSAIAAALTACGAQGTADASDAGSTNAVTPAAADVRHEQSNAGRIAVTTIAGGLRHPWGMAFLPDGQILVTERVGSLRRIDADGRLSAPIDGVPTVVAEGQGGLLDVALSPDFADDRLVYLSYAEPGEGKLASTAVARGRLEGDALQDVEVIFRQQPKLDTRHHFGSRLVFDRDGYLFVTMGDRGVRPTAQDLTSHMGTVARIHPDGSVPSDNPFVGREDAQPETWSWGHRNIQGAALHPASGQLWTHEHGPRGGDEINLPQPGRNYGWPMVTHGINYSGEPIPEAVGTTMDGMEAAHHVWSVSPGVSGMAFYTHSRVPAWQGSLFVGALAQRALIRLSLDGDEITGEERLLGDMKLRIRDVRSGPDGALYVLEDDPNGKLLRVELAAE